MVSAFIMLEATLSNGLYLLICHFKVWCHMEGALFTQEIRKRENSSITGCLTPPPVTRGLVLPVLKGQQAHYYDVCVRVCATEM